MTFKIRDGLKIGTVDVLDSSARLLDPKIKSSSSTFHVTIQNSELSENRTLTLPNTTGTVITSGDSGTVTSSMIANGTIVNDDISDSANIVDTKLNTISTANKISLSALNINGAADINEGLADNDLFIVQNTSAENNKNSKSLASRIPTYVFSKISGDILINSDGTATIQANSVALGTDTTGNYVATISGTDNQISVSGSGSENAAVTLSLPQDIHTSATPTFGGMTLTGSLSMNSVGKITNLVNPSSAQDAATKIYVDEVAQGIRSRSSADVYVATNLSADYNNGPLNDGVGSTLTASANGVFPTTDGIDTTILNVQGTRILVAGQTNKAHNGLYVLTTAGSASVKWVLTRCQECDSSTEIEGSFVFVKLGTNYAGTGWVATVGRSQGASSTEFDVGFDAIDWVQFSGAGTYTAGTGLTLTGNQFSVNANLSHVTGLGTITSGTWQGTIISPTYGGTGVNNGTKTITLGGNFTHTGEHTLTLTTTGNTSVTLPTTGTLATTSNKLNAFAVTSSAELASVINDETGSGSLVFGTSPSFTTSVTTGSTSFDVFNTGATAINAFGAATAISIGSASSGTTTINHNLAVNGNTTLGDASGDTVTLNASTVSVPNNLTFTHDSSTTNTILYPVKVLRTTSSTAAAGIGTGVEFITETAGGNNRIGASIASVATAVTSASETFNFVVNTMTAGGAAAQALRVSNNTLTVGAAATATTITTNGAGSLTITAGSVGSTATGSAVTVIGGAGGSTSGAGGALTLSGGLSTSGQGGVATLRSGSAGGTNQQGSNIIIEAGNGTGTGGSGAIVFRTASPGTSGSTANTVSDRLRINNNGSVDVLGQLTVEGDLIVNGLVTSVNSNTVTVDDKNIELGSISPKSGLTATLSAGVATVTLTTGNTKGLIPGMALSKNSGTGAFGNDARVLNITGETTFTATVNHASAGSITFTAQGASEFTADGGGLTLKGQVDKTFNWIRTTSSWTSSEHIELASSKTFRINGNDVLSQTTLGTTVLNSSLTSVGTLTSGTWQATTIAIAHGGTGATTDAGARTNLGASTVGSNIFTLANPSAERFIRINEDNTVSVLSTDELRALINTAGEASTTVNATNITAVDSWPIASFRSAKYTVQITQGSKYQVSEILVVHNGTTTFMTEYAVIETDGALGSFTSDINGANARLLVTMNSANTATVKISKVTISI